MPGQDMKSPSPQENRISVMRDKGSEDNIISAFLRGAKAGDGRVRAYAVGAGCVQKGAPN